MISLMSVVSPSDKSDGWVMGHPAKILLHFVPIPLY